MVTNPVLPSNSIFVFIFENFFQFCNILDLIIQQYLYSIYMLIAGQNAAACYCSFSFSANSVTQNTARQFSVLILVNQNSDHHPTNENHPITIGSLRLRFKYAGWKKSRKQLGDVRSFDWREQKQPNYDKKRLDVRVRKRKTAVSENVSKTAFKIMNTTEIFFVLTLGFSAFKLLSVPEGALTSTKFERKQTVVIIDK